jgi:hypothetical protein
MISRSRHSTWSVPSKKQWKKRKKWQHNNVREII